MIRKQFPLAAVLSVRGEKLLGTFDKVHKLIEFMVGEPIWTHQLPRAKDPCQKSLVAQFPQLADYNDESVNSENHAQWLADQILKYGEYLEVEPLGEGMWQHKDPVVELEEIVGGIDRVISLKVK